MPSALALWLSGLGIQVIYGRPRQSTDNALIERCNGVLEKWVEPHQQAHFKACQERLDWAIWTQRERYRSPHHETRAVAYPDLYENARTYRRSQDAQLWSLEQAALFLSAYRFSRKVEKNGRINLLGNNYPIGQSYARQVFSIVLQAQSQEWSVSDDYGTEIARFASKELDYEKVQRLQTGRNREKRHKPLS